VLDAALKRLAVDVVRIALAIEERSVEIDRDKAIASGRFCLSGAGLRRKTQAAVVG
jgi:hypothetical protein